MQLLLVSTPTGLTMVRDSITRAARRYLEKRLLSVVPAHNPTVYRLAKKYVDLYNGDNNSDMETNGEFSFMQRNLRKCETVFDIGANVGQWTALALRINPIASIHCFEPSRNTFQRLLANRFPTSVVCNNL